MTCNLFSSKDVHPLIKIYQHNRFARRHYGLRHVIPGTKRLRYFTEEETAQHGMYTAMVYAASFLHGCNVAGRFQDKTVWSCMAHLKCTPDISNKNLGPLVEEHLPAPKIDHKRSDTSPT